MVVNEHGDQDDALNHFGPKSDIPVQIWHHCFHDNAAVVFVFKHVEKNM